MTTDPTNTVIRTGEYPSAVGSGSWQDLDCGCRYTICFEGELAVITCDEHGVARTTARAEMDFECGIYEQGEMDKRKSELVCYRAEHGTITEGQIRELLSQEYGGDNSTRELIKNERKDDHGTVGSVVYSLSGSPPKGYAIHDTGLNSTVWLYDVHGDKFAKVSNVTAVKSGDGND
jgi:hypothetical protein